MLNGSTRVNTPLVRQLGFADPGRSRPTGQDVLRIPVAQVKFPLFGEGVCYAEQLLPELGAVAEEVSRVNPIVSISWPNPTFTPDRIRERRLGECLSALPVHC